MSCGNPHETPCSEVLDRIYDYIDGELDDAERRHEIKHHLEECAPCLREYGLEEAVQRLGLRAAQPLRRVRLGGRELPVGDLVGR